MVGILLLFFLFFLYIAYGKTNALLKLYRSDVKSFLHRLFVRKVRKTGKMSIQPQGKLIPQSKPLFHSLGGRGQVSTFFFFLKVCRSSLLPNLQSTSFRDVCLDAKLCFRANISITAWSVTVIFKRHTVVSVCSSGLNHCITLVKCYTYIYVRTVYTCYMHVYIDVQ